MSKEKQQKKVGEKFGYTQSTVYTIIRDHKKKEGNIHDDYFVTPKKGRKPKENKNEIDELIIDLRKKMLSVQDIKAIVDARGLKTSEKYIYNVLKEEGFTRLHRRSREEKRKYYQV